jgi:hypothetical protein
MGVRTIDLLSVTVATEAPGFRSKAARMMPPGPLTHIVFGRGNPALVFSVCLAFAGPLLALLGKSSIGFAWVGSSSSGKSIVTKFSGSVCGGNPESALGYAETWLKTTNAYDRTIQKYRHGFLVLDETQLADEGLNRIGHAVRHVVFRLSAGIEKERKPDQLPLRRVLWHI